MMLATGRAALVIGQTISHYRIVRALGAGGMGEVYLAEDTKLGRQVALKVLSRDSANDPDRRARFEREARAVAALNHPGIVTIHSVEEDQGVLFLTMELVDGRTLSECIPQGGMTLHQLLKIGIPLTDAIGTAHHRGITHRDLKPANVMVGHDGRVKVLDFGLAKQQSQDSFQGETAMVPTAHVTAEGKILGTVAYMSPEQAEGKPVDQRSDIFSLGIVLFEMATGQRPFKGDSNVSVLSAVLKDTPPLVTDLRSDLPRDLGRIVKRCLAKDPEERYQSAKDLRNDLKALKEDSDSAEIARRDAPLYAGVRRVSAGHGSCRKGGPRRVGRWIWLTTAAVVVLVAGSVRGPVGDAAAEAARDHDASNHDRWRREVTANDGRLAPLLRHRAHSRRTRWVVGPGAGIGIGRRHGGARSGVSRDSRHRPTGTELLVSHTPGTADGDLPCMPVLGGIERRVGISGLTIGAMYGIAAPGRPTSHTSSMRRARDAARQERWQRVADVAHGARYPVCSARVARWRAVALHGARREDRSLRNLGGRADGSHPHPLFSGQTEHKIHAAAPGPPMVAITSFEAGGNLWARSEAGGLFRGASSEPVQLTFGAAAVLGGDAKPGRASGCSPWGISAEAGSHGTTPASKQFVDYLGGISVEGRCGHR
jgi:hypothetical protein